MTLYKKIRFSINFIKAIFKKHFLQILLGLFIGVIFFYFAPKLYKLIPKPRQELKIGRVGQYTINEVPDEILNEVSFGLTSLSESGQVLPALAESWQIEEEGKVYRFKIKQQSFFWHDKSKLTAQDINYNFNDVVFSLENNDLVFRLKEPFSPFLSVLAKPIFKKGLIGLGEYKISNITQKGKFIKSITLVPFDKNNKNLSIKIYKFYKSEKDLKTAFNLGEVNILENLFDIDGINLSKNVTYEQTLKNNLYLAVFLDNSKSFLDVKSFRQALAYAIPKETDPLRVISPISPLSWAYNPGIKPYNQDISHAKTLLETDKEALSSFSLSLTTFPQYEKLAQEIKKAWENIGIKTNIKITTFLPTDFEALLIAREIPIDPDQYYFWHTTQAGNIINLKNPRIDKLLEDGRKTIDQNQRKDIYYDFQRFLAEESPVIFLNHPMLYTVKRK